MTDATEPPIEDVWDALSAYERWKIRRGDWTESSRRTNSVTIAQFVMREPDPPAMWTAEVVSNFVHDDSVSQWTQRSRLARVGGFLRWLHSRGYIDSDLTLEVAPVKMPHQRGPKDVRPDDVVRILEACEDQRERLIVLLMAHCGLRCVDVAQILISDIDTEARLLDVRAKGGRGKVTHTVPLPEEVWAEIAAYLEAAERSEGPLICNSRRLTPQPVSRDRISKIVASLVEKAGLEKLPGDGLGAHALRHTCAVQLIEGGADIRQVQHVLGHRQQATTEIYLRREPPGLRDAMEGRTYGANPAPELVLDFERVRSELYGSQWPVARLGDHWRAGWPERFSSDELDPIWGAIASGHAALTPEGIRAEVLRVWERGRVAVRGSSPRSPRAYRRMLWTVEGLLDRPLWDEISATFAPHVTAWLDQVVAESRVQGPRTP